MPESTNPPENVAVGTFAQALEKDLEDTRGTWNLLHKTYLVLHVLLVSAALVLSGVVIPYAASFGLNRTAFVSGLVVALIIGIQNAFAIGERWAFYSGILAELQALTFQLRHYTSYGSNQPDEQLKQLERIAVKLEQINTRAFLQVPRGQGMAAAEEDNKPM